MGQAWKLLEILQGLGFSPGGRDQMLVVIFLYKNMVPKHMSAYQIVMPKYEYPRSGSKAKYVKLKKEERDKDRKVVIT